VPFGCFEQLQLADAGEKKPNAESEEATRKINSEMRFMPPFPMMTSLRSGSLAAIARVFQKGI